MFETLALAITAFAATTIDDAFLLIGFFANPRLKDHQIIAGQYLGFSALVAASIVCSLLALAFPARYVGVLGVLPIVIGIKQGWTWWLARKTSPAEIQAKGAAATISSVAFVTAANGGDNIAIYVPLFSRQPVSVILTICVVFAILVGVWCAAARRLLANSQYGPPVGMWGHRLTPLVLIGLGCTILVRSGALSALL